MVRRIEITLGEAIAEAELMEGDAPKSSRQILDLLPIEGKPFHTLESGREIFLPIPLEKKIIPENQTIHQIPGDILLYYKPAIYVEPEWPEIKRQIAVIGLCYGRDTQIKGLYMPLPVNIVGKMVEGLEQLEEEAIRLRNTGLEKMMIT